MQNNAFIEKLTHPIRQAAFVIGLGFVVMLGYALLKWLNIFDAGHEFPWMTAAAFLLFFALLNGVMSIQTNRLEWYFRYSFAAFGIVVVVSCLLAWLFSATWISDAGTYSSIFIVLTLGYLVLLSIGGLIKRIFILLQREEERERKRHRDRERLN